MKNNMSKRKKFSKTGINIITKQEMKN